MELVKSSNKTQTQHELVFGEFRLNHIGKRFLETDQGGIKDSDELVLMLVPGARRSLSVDERVAWAMNDAGPAPNRLRMQMPQLGVVLRM